MKALSCPATMEVSFQSMRMLAIRMPDQAEIYSIGSVRRSTRKSNLQVPRGPRSGQPRTKHFEPDFRLSQGSAKGLFGHIGIYGIAHVGKS